jgi:predicted ribosomally synthesized peptide with nif11-like leader
VSTENIQAFLEKADQEPLLNGHVRAALDGSPEAVAVEFSRLAAEAGIPFGADEFSAYARAQSIDDAELDNVAGGVLHHTNLKKQNPDAPFTWDKIKNIFS